MQATHRRSWLVPALAILAFEGCCRGRGLEGDFTFDYADGCPTHVGLTLEIGAQPEWVELDIGPFEDESIRTETLAPVEDRDLVMFWFGQAMGGLQVAFEARGYTGGRAVSYGRFFLPAVPPVELEAVLFADLALVPCPALDDPICGSGVITYCEGGQTIELTCVDGCADARLCAVPSKPCMGGPECGECPGEYSCP